MGIATDTVAVRERVAGEARRLAAEGLVLGTAGNVSERSGELVAVTPTGAVLAELHADQVAIVDLEGRQVEGELAPTSELYLHLGIYRMFDAGAVVHSHSPIATALACVLDELPVIHYVQLALGGPVAVAPYETFGTQELAEATLAALAGRRAALMANHGAIVYAADARSAVEDSLLLEWLCGLYWRAAAIGTPRTLTEDQCQAFVSAMIERGYGEARPGSG
jgi:L-fuculose-phosphate aldolase